MKTVFTSTLAQQLDRYQEQAVAYKKTTKHSQKQLVRVGALAALAPLAAVSMLPINTAQAQCNVGATYTRGTTSGCPDLVININGIDEDGSGPLMGGDINIFGNASGNIYITATNADLQFPGYAAGVTYVSAAASGAALPGAFVFDQSNGYLIYSSTNGPFTGGGYIPIGIDTDNDGIVDSYGFIEISIDGNGCVVLESYGVEGPDDPNPGAVTVGECSTLPVELLAFRAVAGETTIRLEWETASEVNNQGFELQRSTNGKEFQKVTWINGQGSSQEAHQYSYTDEKAIANQQYYYRLKQLDMDGSVNYSEVISAQIDNGDKLKIGAIVPNPTQGVSQLAIAVAHNSDATIELFSTTGQMLWNTTEQLASGKNNVELDVQNLPKGSYFVKITVDSETNYRKLIIE